MPQRCQPLCSSLRALRCARICGTDSPVRVEMPRFRPKEPIDARHRPPLLPAPASTVPAPPAPADARARPRRRRRRRRSRPACACGAGCACAEARRPPAAAADDAPRRSAPRPAPMPAQTDGAGRAQRLHLVVAVAEPREQLVRVRAEARRLQAHRQPLAVQRDREQRRLHRLAGLVAVGQHDVGEAAGGQQVRVVVQVLGPADGRERQAGVLEQRRQLVGRCDARGARAPWPAAPGAPHAIVVGRVAPGRP